MIDFIPTDLASPLLLAKFSQATVGVSVGFFAGVVANGPCDNCSASPLLADLRDVHFGAVYAIANELLKRMKLKRGDIRRIVKTARPYGPPCLAQRRDVLLEQAPLYWEKEIRRQLSYSPPSAPTT